MQYLLPEMVPVRLVLPVDLAMGHEARLVVENVAVDHVTAYFVGVRAEHQLEHHLDDVMVHRLDY